MAVAAVFETIMHSNGKSQLADHALSASRSESSRVRSQRILTVREARTEDRTCPKAEG